MIPVLALDLGSPLMLMFGMAAAAVMGGVAGYVLGTTLGRTPPETPLPTTVRLTRERLASVVSDLEKASKALNASQRSDLAGSALVLGRRASDASSRLGSIEHRAKRGKEGSA